MYLVMWEFTVRESSRAEFEQVYGPGGDWQRFFERMEDFLGTELLQDEEAPERYISIDRWSSAEAYRRFRRENAEEYNALDARSEALTGKETFLGGFESE